MISSLRRIQRGQAAVAVMLFMAILVVAALALFKSGKLTSNKMQLQNAADAAAYSMALVEARDLNFAAYMNRAIVANEVAIGQMVGLASWGFYIGSYADYIRAYDTLILSPITLGISTPIMNGMAAPFEAIGGVAQPVLTKIANFATTVLHTINKAYGYAQYYYHVISAILGIGTMLEVVQDNGPPGTKLSDYGILSLILHMYTYGALPLDLPGEQFTQGYSPTKKIPADEFNDSGYARLAALIRDSRDPFTMGRGWSVNLSPFPTTPIPAGGLFPFDRGPFRTPDSPPFVVDLGIIGWDMYFTLGLDMIIAREGASELRARVPGSGQVEPGSIINWSSADTTDLTAQFFIEAGLELYVLPEPFRTTVFDAVIFGAIMDQKLTFYVDFGGDLAADTADCEAANDDITAANDADDDPSNDQPLNDCDASAGADWSLVIDLGFDPLSAPFASGFAEVAKGTANDLSILNMNKTTTGGPIEADHYGGAPGNLISWASPGIPPPLPLGIQFSAGPPQQNIAGTKVNTKYGGLPHYVDTTGSESTLWGWGSPFMIVGLVQDEDDFDSNAVAAEPSGRFGVNEALADGELGVIAKSELYFSRPTDVLASHFHRGDGQAEYGSGFNPYWQARLVETTYAERISALLVQQKEDFINLGQSFNLIFGPLLDYIPGT